MTRGFGNPASLACGAARTREGKNALMESLASTATVIVTILLVGIALAGLVHNGQMRLESRLTAVEGRLVTVEKETARIGGLLEGFGLAGRTMPPESG